MSYEIVKQVIIKDNKVLLKSASNNVYPLHFILWECGSLSKILQEKGLSACEIEILKEYETGNFQAGNKNKYTRALNILYYVLNEEYKKFNWRNEGDAYEEANKLRETEDFNNLLKKALNFKNIKGYFIIKLGKGYINKITKRHIFYTHSESEAKKFKFYKEAEYHLNGINKEDYIIIKK